MDALSAVIKVLAAFESAGEQLAQHPTTGLFYITVSTLHVRILGLHAVVTSSPATIAALVQDHVKTSVPALVFRAQNLQQQRQGYQVCFS